jgi:hypothetical protein
MNKGTYEGYKLAKNEFENALKVKNTSEAQQLYDAAVTKCKESLGAQVP